MIYNDTDKFNFSFIADLHTHSHYAAATSKFLCLETLYQWALIKGIDVVGTGGFTHPAWTNELEEKLQPAGNGFFTLKNLSLINVLEDIKLQHKEIFFCLSSEANCDFIAGYDGVPCRISFFEKDELHQFNVPQLSMF